MPKIFLPTPLRPFAQDAAAVEAPGATVAEVLEALVSRYAGLRAHLFDDAGKLRAFVNVYKNDEDIRHLDRERTAVAESDTLSIVPSIAGGAPPTSTGLDAAALTREELQRYARHLIMPEVGAEGQAKLKAGRVLLVGTGGLGSPARCISRPPAWARSAWSISTSSIRRISTARSSSAPPTWGARSSKPRWRGFPTSTRTCASCPSRSA